MFELAADDGDAAVRYRCFLSRELEVVSDAFRSDASNTDFDIDHLFKLDRLPIIAVRIDSRPADFLTIDRADDTKSNAAKKCVLGLLHIGEEVGEVHDARHVGIAKLDAARVFECIGHALAGNVGE